MKIQTQQLLEYIYNEPQTTATQMAKYFNVSKVTIHAHLKKLINSWKLMKQWKAPFVRYVPVDSDIYQEKTSDSMFGQSAQRLLTQERYQIAKDGKELSWANGFVTRCEHRQIEARAAVSRRSDHIWTIDALTSRHGIDATKKLHDYGHDVLIHLRYGSIYALPEFGKTRMGTYMDIAKTHPNPQTFAQLMNETLWYIQHIVQDYTIDALCFASPTASRSLQIMTFLRTHISDRLWLPVIPLIKLPWFFPAQKTLKKREDRIANAKASFGIKTYTKKHKNVLIIDDAVWSWATLVEIARKIMDWGIWKNCYAFSLVWTANGVISGVKKFEVLASV